MKSSIAYLVIFIGILSFLGCQKNNKDEITPNVKDVTNGNIETLPQEYYNVNSQPSEFREIMIKLPCTEESFETTVELIDGLVIWSGDIILGTETEIFGNTAGHASKRAIVTVFNDLWPEGIIPYEINEKALDKSTIFTINQAIAYVNSVTNLCLMQSNNNINYVEFTSGNTSSSVGMIGGKQLLKVSSNAVKGNVVHEILHAAGLYHEHQRFDRDNFVTIFTSNIGGGGNNFSIIPVETGIPLGLYDYGSIMHYSTNANSNGNGPTIVPITPTPAGAIPLLPGVELGQRDALSIEDIAQINEIYPNPNSCSSSVGAWSLSYSGESSWQVINYSNFGLDELAFGDFNGDGKADVFSILSGDWRVSYSGTSTWQVINYSNFGLDELAFGDFNGDGVTDVFHVSGGNWRVSYSGTSAWQVINNSTVSFDKLAFGDFNGDGVTDVFNVSGGNWRVSYSGTSAWQVINSSVVEQDQLAFGDFDGDGETDVFNISGGNWRVSYSGTGQWQVINNSNIGLSFLAFGDFNGDGVTDVFSTSENNWIVSYSGTSTWQVINNSSYGLNQIGFSDFNGDGRTDVFRGTGY